ncbi:uncharacterized protein LOC130780647 [Actinidia eriantha]|uniref:uncharacterized protein LOC130780647 n=1 Tax=Actinidia eriantha TaxID=165200 RepID=UPI002588E38C|nr:uncharacterized protein LOC130780647 [Actinidia eriantha]
MAVILRYVDKKGYIIERFLGIVHVRDTISLSLKASIESLKASIESLFAKHELSMSSLRSQGYDGASNMQVRGRSCLNAQETTHLHHYRVELFYTVVDMQLQELNNCFNELMKLDNQLETYFLDVSSNDQFFDVKGISGLAQKLVETKNDVIYPLIYLLIKLALILPVATASIERVFSAMNIIKTSLRNRMEDEWMNDCLVTYIERDIYNTINNEVILQMFQNIKQRRGLL